MHANGINNIRYESPQLLVTKSSTESMEETMYYRHIFRYIYTSFDIARWTFSIHVASLVILWIWSLACGCPCVNTCARRRERHFSARASLHQNSASFFSFFFPNLKKKGKERKEKERKGKERNEARDWNRRKKVTGKERWETKTRPGLLHSRNLIKHFIFSLVTLAPWST